VPFGEMSTLTTQLARDQRRPTGPTLILARLAEETDLRPLPQDPTACSPTSRQRFGLHTPQARQYYPNVHDL